MKQAILILTAGVLVVSLWWTLGSTKASGPTGYTLSEPLSARLPRQSGSWNGSDQPLASTELANAKTAEVLAFDDVVYRSYRRGGDELSIYIAYWRDGKTSVREVQSHVPDICWRAAGWRLDERVLGQHVAIPKGGYLPCEYRVFSAAGASTHVIYWHLLAGQLVLDYGTERAVPWWAVFRDVFRYGRSLNAEQYFVRISSHRDLRQLQLEPDVQDLLHLVLQAIGHDSAPIPPKHGSIQSNKSALEARPSSGQPRRPADLFPVRRNPIT